MAFPLDVWRENSTVCPVPQIHIWILWVSLYSMDTTKEESIHSKLAAMWPVLFYSIDWKQKQGVQNCKILSALVWSQFLHIHLCMMPMKSNLGRFFFFNLQVHVWQTMQYSLFKWRCKPWPDIPETPWKSQINITSWKESSPVSNQLVLGFLFSKGKSLVCFWEANCKNPFARLSKHLCQLVNLEQVKEKILWSWPWNLPFIWLSQIKVTTHQDSPEGKRSLKFFSVSMLNVNQILLIYFFPKVMLQN